MSKAEITKAFIIEKTAPLFNTKGFVGTTLSDITAATGLTKGSIYSNFENKDEVALAVFDYNLRTVNSLIKKEMGKCDSPKDKLLAYVNVYNYDIRKSPFPAGGCPILNTAIDADDTHPALRKKANTALLAWKDKIIDLINEGINDKSFKPSVNPEAVALTIIATIEGGIMISKATGKINHLRTILKSVEKIIHDLE